MQSQPAQPTVLFTATWSGRKKRWDLHVRGSAQGREWAWTLEADTTVEIDRGTAYLMLLGLKEALEAQLL